MQYAATCSCYISTVLVSCDTTTVYYAFQVAVQQLPHTPHTERVEPITVAVILTEPVQQLL
jgi:hypothetical protein